MKGKLMTTIVTNPVVMTIAAWDADSLPTVPTVAEVVPEVTPEVAPEAERVTVLNTLTWVQAAVKVMPADGNSMTIAAVLRNIQDAGLRDLSGARTPIQTLRRDLNAEARKDNARVKVVCKGVYARN